MTMGLLADFVVASPSDALQYASLMREGNSLPAHRFESCEYKNYTPLSLGLLWALLANEKWDAKRHKLETVTIADGGHTWLLRFPDEFAKLIVEIDERKIQRIAYTWADDDDVPGDGADNEPVIEDLKRLAIQAQIKGHNLYLWGSL
jgi:hypothetical protein